MRLLASVLLWAAAGHPAVAEDAAEQGAGEQLEVVGRPRATLAHRLDAEDLDLTGVQTLAEALQWVAGATTRTAGSGESRIDLRGSRTRSTCVLLDGVPVTSPWDGSFDLSHVPVLAVRSIEVLPGPQGALLVPGCPGGVIDVRLRDPADERGGEVRADGGTGRYAALRGAAASGEAEPGRVEGLAGLHASRRDFTGVPASFTPLNAEDGGRRELSDRGDLAAVGRLAWEVGSSRFGLGAHGLLGEHGIPPDTSIRPRFRRVTFLERQQVGATWTVAPRDGLSLASQAHGVWMAMDAERFADVDLGDAVGAESVRAAGLGGALALRATPRPWLGLSMFAAAEGDRARTWESDDVEERTQEAGAWDWTGGGGVVLSPRPATSFEAWLRAYGWGADHPVTPCGRVQASWSFLEQTRLVASASRGARAPTLRERFDVTRGTPNLLPEQVEQAELAVEGAAGAALFLDVAAWHRWEHDVINSPNEGQPFTNNPDNRTMGVESALQVQPAPALRVRLGHAWIRVAEGSIDHVPDHHLLGGARVRLPKELVFDTDLEWVGERASGAVMLEPYTLWDLQLTRELPRGVWARMRVANVLDTLYEERALEPQPGRNLVLSIGGRWWRS